MGPVSDSPRPLLLWALRASGPLAALCVGTLFEQLHRIPGQGSRPAYAAAVMAWMAAWWFTEAVSISITACLPLVLFPLFDVLGKGAWVDFQQTAAAFVDAYVFLFLGGMAIGAAMEERGLHRRIALHIMRRIGTEPKRLLLGMLVATAFVSLWISNTATAVMMLPIAMALIRELEKARGGDRLAEFGCALALAVAYASNIGGIGTKIGTGTNSIFVGFAAVRGFDVDFLRFSLVSFPLVVLLLPTAWLALWSFARRDRIESGSGGVVLERELALLGPIERHERTVIVVFLTAAACWMFGDLVRPLLVPVVSRLTGLTPLAKHYEATVALLAAFVLLATRTLTGGALRRIPYAVLLLIGGSFALAEGVGQSGLAAWFGQKLSSFRDMPLLGQYLLTSLGSVGLSAVASNTATVNVVLNVLPPSLGLWFAAALASSCDFMLPAGTPPNAIVFGSGYVRLSTMIRVGFVLDLAAALIVGGYMFAIGRWLLP